MDSFLRAARAKQNQMIASMRELVECESPSGDPAALDRFAKLFSRQVGDIAGVKRFDGGHLRCEFSLPAARKKTGQLLALGHSDTVWPMGTLQTMPFRQSRGRLWGPGVLDMKAGLVFFVFAMRILRELDIPAVKRVVLQINADEETGSQSSRALTEEAARRSEAVLVLEPGTGLEGKVKTARKGVGDYRVTVRGQAAHAGLDFEKGANAVLEMARQVQRIATFTRLDRGVTVSPGVIHGGTRSNVVPAVCQVEIDVRAPRAADGRYLQRQFASLKPFDKRCTIEVAGGLNRPPMERSAAVRKLFVTARKLAAEIGVDLEESASGGGSDGNFTAALGVPTLDGLGAVGEGAHAPHESILIHRIADRTALLAKLVATLGAALP
ncbi:MAG TPA: M20 family metallopeptidase [Bryobacteraceae bacterium]